MYYQTSNDVQKIRAWLEEIQVETNPFAIAKQCSEMGITARPKEIGWQHPLAQYVYKMLLEEWRTVEFEDVSLYEEERRYQIVYRNKFEDYITRNLPPVLKDFHDYWMNGHFPELERKNEK